MNRLQMYVDGCPHWAKAYSRAYRMALLAFIPIGCLSPCGMRMLDAYGVMVPTADLMLVGVMALPFIGIFLWAFLCERFWDWAIARFAVVRFVLEWAFAIYFLEFGILLLVVTRIGMMDHVLSRW